MQNRVYTACDNCAAVIDGMFKAQRVKKSYISFRGSLCLKSYDKNSIEHFTYANPSKEEALNTFMHFCNGVCLDEFLQTRLILKSEYHQDNNLPDVDYAPPVPR